ncbi:MAG: histidinol-phosphatase [Peptococcaceae bacterium]|nr:histidinol-phosphatase [Peptococcaceae bacterium]
MELTDTHTHTALSNHGIGTVDEVVNAARAKGLTTVALTEHMPLPLEADPLGDCTMAADKVAFYLDCVAAAQARYTDIEIICGTEVDWRPGAESYILSRLGPYELLLGSVHMLTGPWPFDHPGHMDGWHERGEEAVWREYFTLWSEAVQSSVPFTIMAHPDLPKKLGCKPSFDAAGLYESAAALARKHDVMIEVNTSGLYKPVGELYPGPQFLSAFAAAGVPCTVSSDAHRPQDVGRDLDKAYAAMRAAGYRHVTVPTRSGDRRTLSLSKN